MSDEQNRVRIAALVNERGGYGRRLADAEKNAAPGEVERMQGRIAAVDADLKRIQGDAAPPIQRATRVRRPRATQA